MSFYADYIFPAVLDVATKPYTQPLSLLNAANHAHIVKLIGSPL